MTRADICEASLVAMPRLEASCQPLGGEGTSGDMTTFNRPLQDAIIYRIWFLDSDTVLSLLRSMEILHNIKEPQKCMAVNSLRSKFPIPLWEFSFVFAKLSFLIYFQEGG